MKNLGIARKLAFGLGLLIALMIGVAGAGYWGQNITHKTIHTLLADDTKLAEDSLQARIDILEMRRFEKDHQLNMGEKATREISGPAGSSVKVSERSGNLLNKPVPTIKKTTEPGQEVSAVSNEHSSGVGQINRAMSQVDHVTQQNASAAEELALTAEEMASQAESLQQLMGFFRLGELAELHPARPQRTPAPRTTASHPTPESRATELLASQTTFPTVETSHPGVEGRTEGFSMQYRSAKPNGSGKPAGDRQDHEFVQF